MSGKGTCFVASLFGIHLSEDAPRLQSLVPQRISNEIMAGNLPKFNPLTVLLEKNETCHFMDRAALAVKQRECSYFNYRSGNSYKVTKNWTMHSTRGNTKPIEQEWYEFKEGIVFVTNKRIIFVDPEYGFEKKIKNLTAVIPYIDAMVLQFKSQTINIMVPQPRIMMMVLQMIMR